MKKILSSFLALAMLATSMMAFSTIASADGVVNVTTTIEELDTEDAAAVAEFTTAYSFAPSDLGAIATDPFYIYEVTTTVSGLGASVTAKKPTLGTNYQYSGSIVQSFNMVYAFDTSILFDFEGLTAPKEIAANEIGAGMNNLGSGIKFVLAASTDNTAHEPYKTAVNDTGRNETTVYDLNEVTFNYFLITNTNDFDINVLLEGGNVKDFTNNANALVITAANVAYEDGEAGEDPDGIVIAPSQGGEGGDDDESVLEDVTGLTGELAQYNSAKMFRANATNLTVDADDKLVITSVDTEESKTMSRTLWKALDLEGDAPVDISSLTVVVMVTADAENYANGFTFSLE